MYYDIRRMEECRVSLGPTYEEFRYVVSNSGIYFYFDMHRNPRTCSSHLDASSLDFPRNRDLERKLSEGHRISGTTFFLSRLLKCDHRDLEGYTKRWKRGNLRIYIARHQGKRRNATAHYILSEQRAFNGVVNQSQSRTIVRSTTLSSSSSTSRLPTLCERMWINFVAARRTALIFSRLLPANRSWSQVGEGLSRKNLISRIKNYLWKF